jgi:hypothetical protein
MRGVATPLTLSTACVAALMKTLKSTIFSLCLAICAIGGGATLTAKSYENLPMDPDATLQVKPGQSIVEFGEALCDGSPTNILKANVTEKDGAMQISYAVDNGRDLQDEKGCKVQRTLIGGGGTVTLRPGKVAERDLDGFLIRFQG